MMKMKSKIKNNLDFKLLSVVILSMFAFASTGQNTLKIEQHKGIEAKVAKKQVSGVVIDASTGEPLVGIRVQAFNNNLYSSMTSEDGTFKLDVPEYVTSLSAVAEGYGLVMNPIDSKTNTVKIKMFSDEFSGIYSKTIKASKDKTASVNNMNSDLSIDRQIQTNLGGDIRAVVRSGQQGVGNFMLMNGLNSLFANTQPLVVVDGVILDMQYSRGTVHEGFYNNLLSNINVNDIENISVVKNGTALYGAKGGNGVLLIETKRNKSMATKIDVDLSGNFEMIPNLPPMMDATDYRYYASELLGSTGTKLTEFKFLKSDPKYYYYNKFNNNTDWSKQVYQQAFSQSYGINVQGGDEIASYNLSVGYANGNSTLKNSELSRFNLRLNSDINLSNKIDVRFDASYSDINRNLRDDGVKNNIENTTVTSVGLLGLIKAPFLSPNQFDIYGNKSDFLSDADDYLDEVLGTDVSLANPSSLLYYGEGKNKNRFGNRMINLAITPIYKIKRNLTLREHFSYTLTNTDANYYTPLRGMPSLIIEDVATVQNVAKAMASHSNIFSSDTRLDWTKNIKAHKLHVFGGARLFKDSYSLNMIQGYNTGNDKTPNINNNLSYKTVTGTDDNNVSLTYYALADYNYKEKYFLYGGLSAEASSRFGKEIEGGLKLFGVSWGLFPSIQAAWVMTSESWFKPNDIVNFVKVNAGFDISGNDDLDCLASRSYFGATRILNSAGGLVLSNIGNTSLQWETTQRLTAGLDANLFNNTLNVSINYFNATTDNLLSMKKLKYVGGIDRIWSNDGSLLNHGTDFSFKYRLLNAKAVKMEIGASVAHYKNKVKSLPEGVDSYITEMYSGAVLTKVGSSLGEFYGYKTNGVYSTTDQAQADGKYIVLKNGDKKYFKAGDMNFETTNDAEVNEADKVVIGNPNPDLYGNIFANISLKKLTLSTVFNYSVGNDIYNYQRMVLEGGKSFYNQTTAMKNRWTTEGQITDIPVITFEDPMGNSRFSDRWIEDGSYLRLKTVTLSYNIPIRSTYLQGLTFWGSANNLVTFTKYLGGDPENSSSNNILLQGIDRGLLPQGRNFALGIKINI